LKQFDVVALGEILIDMTYAGKSEAGQTLFEQNPGGAPANVLAAVQRLGGQTAFIGKVGKDMHGEYLRQVLAGENICTEGLLADENAFTTLAFVNLDANGDRSFSFARKPGADTCLTKEEVKYSLIQNSKIFHVGSLSLTDEPAKSATLAALEEAKNAGCIISYDPNYRGPLWKNESAAIEGMRSILSYVDVMKISDEETVLLTDCKEPRKAAEALIAGGVKAVIVTMGGKGALVGNEKGFITSEAMDVPVKDTTGAGDSFMGGFLFKLAQSGKKCEELSIEELQSFADFANRVAGFCVQKRGAIVAMPFAKDLF